jgi:hypothetical protein
LSSHLFASLNTSGYAVIWFVFLRFYAIFWRNYR